MFKFLTILLIQVLCGMEMDLFIPSFPELQKVFDLTPAMVQLTLSVNFMAFCICSLFSGALGDRYNRRTILLSGLMLFVFGSVLCVLASHFFVLLLGRFFQGIGISAPAILSFAVLLEDYSQDKQPGVMGVINGVKTLAMALAPVIGSFINLYLGWRGNFSVLLVLGFLCLGVSLFSIPPKKGNLNVSLSLKTYLPLLRSSQVMSTLFGLGLLVASYWLFFSMAPIFYMEGMGVPLAYFGYYQGILSLTFALVCILSPKVLAQFGRHRCLHAGLSACFVSGLLVMLLVLLKVHEPFIITLALMFFSAAIVFPINIIYPFSLEILPYVKGRAAGLGQAITLLLTAVLIELAAYFYHGQFTPIGLGMFISIIASLVLLQRGQLNTRIKA